MESSLQEEIKNAIFEIINTYGIWGILLLAIIGILIFGCFLLYKFLKSKNIIKAGGVEGEVRELKERLLKKLGEIEKKYNSIENELIRISGYIEAKKRKR